MTNWEREEVNPQTELHFFADTEILSRDLDRESSSKAQALNAFTVAIAEVLLSTAVAA